MSTVVHQKRVEKVLPYHLYSQYKSKIYLGVKGIVQLDPRQE